MSLIQDVRKSVDTTPLYAALGVTDLAAEKVREANVRAAQTRAQYADYATKVRSDYALPRLQTRAQDEAERVMGQVQAFPGQALDATMTLAGNLGKAYEDLAVRGESLVSRIRNQKSTQDLIKQAESTVAMGKGAVTTAKNSLDEVEASAKATLTTGRKEAARAAKVIADSVVDEATEATDEVATSVKRTRAAAKRTTTTAKKGTKRTTSRAKATTTGAKKTAATTRKATRKAAAKVGD